ncbi:MAG: aldo/keto reductase [Candidatus Sumerlaeota bacterium]|nr:aldo/keto reductase [Candidatus Sumerlaeota bacterium]
MTDSHDATRRTFLKTVGLGAAGAALSLGASAAETESAAAPAGAGPLKADIPLRDFGKTGIKVPEIAFGSMDTTQSNPQVLRAALNAGMTFIDTAPAYSKTLTETIIGDTLKTFGRDKVIILTKATGVPHASLRDKPAADAEAAIRKVLEESLKRLQTDHVDFFACPHGANDPADVDYPGLRETIEKLKKEGKIRFFGVSSHQNYVAVCDKAIASGYHDFIMPAVAITTMDPEMLAKVSGGNEGEASESGAKAPARQKAGRARAGKKFEDFRDTLAKAKQAGLAVVAMKIAKFVDPAKLGEAMRAKYAPDGVQISHHQICYRFVLDQPGITTISVGMGAVQHLEEALQLPKLQLKKA